MTTETAVQATDQPLAILPARLTAGRLQALRRAAVEHAPELLLLGGTAVLYLWNLAASGWANAYYSAAALAGSQSWEAFLFGSFDAGNAITVDKTPAALWVMSLSVRLFGLSAWSVLVPQALMGVVAVWLLYLTVSRSVGRLAGLVAGTALALTPVAALMFRYNNPDALLVLLLVGAAYATTRALEHGSTRWLVLAGVFVGFGFLAKMLQAFLVIPAFTLVYLWAAPVSWLRRVVQVGLAALAVVVSAGWYVALVELWPASARPYIGGSQSNSLVELMFGYNGLGRILGNEVGRVGGGGPFSEGAGLLRLFDGELAGEASWLLPAALLALVAILIGRGRAVRTDPVRAQALLWGGWLLGTGLVFSLMEGIFHEYYTVALAPAIGALVGVGVGLAWRHRDRFAVALLGGMTLLVTSAWTVHILELSPTWNAWLAPLIVAVGLVAFTAILLAASARTGPVPRLGLATALAALLAAPALGSIATAATPYTGALPTAEPVATVATGRGGFGGPSGGTFGGRFPGGGQLPNGGQFPGGITLGPGGIGGGPGGTRVVPNLNGRSGRGGIGGLLDAAQADPALVAALKDGAANYTWTAATTGSNNAAGLALSSGTSVMAIGGFNGSDPSPTLEQFQADVAAGRIHYYVATEDAAGFRGTQGGSDAAARIAAWVESTFERQTIGGASVYDLSRST